LHEGGNEIGVDKMKRLTPVVAILIVAVALAAVNATAFAYRWMTATVTVEGPTAARGIACVGFYSSATQSGITLPDAGTNYNAKTYDDQAISVTPGQVVCQWAVDTTTYSLYESITVNVPVTVGSWYIKDFYGFGYNGTASDPTVYVYIKVEQPITDSNIDTAYLYIYYPRDLLAATVNLKTGEVTGAPIMLRPGDGLQLDLSIRATGETSATFKVGFYATYSSSEAPR
jgi:hypothetical protein